MSKKSHVGNRFAGMFQSCRNPIPTSAVPWYCIPAARQRKRTESHLLAAFFISFPAPENSSLPLTDGARLPSRTLRAISFESYILKTTPSQSYKVWNCPPRMAQIIEGRHWKLRPESFALTSNPHIYRKKRIYDFLHPKKILCCSFSGRRPCALLLWLPCTCLNYDFESRCI